MDNIIVAVIMISMIAAFVIGAIIAQKKGHAGFAASARYDERLAERSGKERPKEED